MAFSVWVAVGIFAAIVVGALVNLLTRDLAWRPSPRALLAAVIVFALIQVFAVSAGSPAPTSSAVAVSSSAEARGAETSPSTDSGRPATRGGPSAPQDPPPTDQTTTGASGSVPPTSPVGSIAEGEYPVGEDSYYPGGGKYHARISQAIVADKKVTVRFEAFGAEDLRKPETSCLRDRNGTLRRVFDFRLEVNAKGHYKGQLEFALVELQRPLLFQYSCSDYEEIQIIP